MSEYLKDFGKDVDRFLSWQEILERGEPIVKVSLIDFLTRANNFLTQELGPNLERRRRLAPDWLGFWILDLKYSRKDQRPALLLPLDRIRRYQDPDFPTGVLFAGALEGHQGHREAVNWMLRFVRPIILFEQDDYVATKERKAPFLPLEVRLSMWSYYHPNLILSVMPKREPGVPENEHYQSIFETIGADYCFATEDDSHVEEKRKRGKSAYFTLIPYVDTESTTLRVQKLAPDDEDPTIPGLKGY